MEEIKKQDESTKREFATVLLPQIELDETFAEVEKKMYKAIIALHKAGLFTRNCIAENKSNQFFAPTYIAFSQELGAQDQFRAISILKETYREEGVNPDDMFFVFTPSWSVGKSINHLGQEVLYPYFNSLLMICSDAKIFTQLAPELLCGKHYDDFALSHSHLIRYSDRFSQEV